MFVKEDRETGKAVQKPCLFKAKFHYTDTDTDKVRARCRVRAKFHYTDTGTDTDTDFFAAKRTRTDPTEFRRKKVRVRVSVVEFSYYATKSQRATRQSQRLRLCRAIKVANSCDKIAR